MRREKARRRVQNSVNIQPNIHSQITAIRIQIPVSPSPT